jgi:hypothetical protein
MEKDAVKLLILMCEKEDKAAIPHPQLERL